MRKYFLEIAVVICGFAVMVFEIVGSRIFAPYLGTSLYVWTSIIGVVLASLSVGYWWGGKLADRGATPRTLALIISLAGGMMLLVAIFKFSFLVILGSSDLDLRLAAPLGALGIFGPVSTLLGMVSPYAVRLKITSLDVSGRLVGNLYALSTLGSIVGTFLAGFVLVVYLGTTKILFLLAALLFVASFVVVASGNRLVRGLLLVFALTFVAAPVPFRSLFAAQGIVADVDTQYNRFLILESHDTATKRPTINLVSSREATQAGMFLDNDDDLVYPYSKYYRLGDFFNPGIKNALMIGGGAYSYPKDFLAKHPNAHLDVVEIDPGVTALAKEYFNLKDSPHLNIYHEDGRAFLNRTDTKYDVIYGDAFHSYFDIPFQLTTLEAVQKISDTLNDNGVYIVNINASLGGPGATFLQAEIATLQKVFPQVYVLPVTSETDSSLLQNIMLVALKTQAVPEWSAATGETREFLARRQPVVIPPGTVVLTDNYAPIEQYLLPLVKK